MRGAATAGGLFRRSATGDAAKAMKLQNSGIIAKGAWADLIVFDRNPLADIRNTKSIHSVWIAGNQLPRPGAAR